ncbi:MAG TPA: hypothetical protein VFE34_11695 [Dongiaceae bacterium]|jgi:hypothetical protein|nr:hypothetical protein [Dongiaceae bacterium]
MSYNVFADLDLPNPDELFLRAALLRAVRDVMRKVRADTGAAGGEDRTEAARRFKDPEWPRARFFDRSTRAHRVQAGLSAGG